MYELLKSFPLVPVIIIDDAEYAVPLAKAILAGGIKILEITLRTPAALAAIEKISHYLPEAMVGAGTVIDIEQFQQIKNAGAKFAVSPGLAPELVHAAQELELPYLPAVATSSEVLSARLFGLKAAKFFPAEISGGIKWLSAIHSVFPDMYFCPTGGINEKNITDYLTQKNVVSVGGSWLTPKHLIEKRDWQTITALVKDALARCTS